jgi:16S rRNA (uracil1498-N3)-methyltransferase
MAKSRGRLFFAQRCDEATGSATLPEDEARHAYRVLRLSAGDEIGVLYEGRRYPGVLDGERGVRLTGPGETQPKPAVDVLLGVGRPKQQAGTEIVETATALGAAEIAFIQTERSVIRGMSGHERWERAAREACKQCGRFQPPSVDGPCAFTRWLERTRDARLKLRLAETGGESMALIAAAIDAAGPIAVLCGPEGGLAAQEEEAAERAGFRAASLGPLVLRVELAIAAVLGCLAPSIWADRTS